MIKLQQLQQDIARCRHCEAELPLGPRPVLQVGRQAKILIAGQAPGRRVHESGVPFDDASGNRLREWLNMDASVFYDPQQVAILPMAFCYPGSSPNGDLPPPKVCAQKWRQQVLAQMPNIVLTLVIGQYAQAWHFDDTVGNLTQRVQQWQRYWPEQVPLPHPSPRNNRWLRNNPWFEQQLLPRLQQRIKQILV